MLFLISLNFQFSSYLLEDAKATLALSMKKAIIVSIGRTPFLDAARTAGAAAVCKEIRECYSRLLTSIIDKHTGTK